MAQSYKPWDARLAAIVVAPLRGTGVTPNHLTTVRLIVGAIGAGLFAQGDADNIAALIIVVSNFLDHTDGELARLSGQASKFGHNYDLAADGLVTVGLFFCIGIGLAPSLGSGALWLGGLAGISVAGIFQLRNNIEQQYGKAATAQPKLGGFEAEDILYGLPLVTLVNGLEWFLIAAAIGAPIALAASAAQYIALEKRV